MASRDAERAVYHWADANVGHLAVWAIRKLHPPTGRVGLSGPGRARDSLEFAAKNALPGRTASDPPAKREGDYPAQQARAAEIARHLGIDFDLDERPLRTVHGGELINLELVKVIQRILTRR